MAFPPNFNTQSTCNACGKRVLIKHTKDAIFRPNQCGYCDSTDLTHVEVIKLKYMLSHPVTYLRMLLAKK